jgi:hypothetical protein
MNATALAPFTLEEQESEVEFFNIDKHGQFIKVQENVPEGAINSLNVRDQSGHTRLVSVWVEVDSTRKANVSMIQCLLDESRFQPRYYASHLLADMAFAYLKEQPGFDIEKIPDNFIGRKLSELIPFLKKNIA